MSDTCKECKKAIGGIGASGWDVKKKLVERELGLTEAWTPDFQESSDWHGEASQTLGEEDA